MAAFRQLPFVLAGVVLMTLQPLLVTLSQNRDGGLDYNPVASTLLTELAKICISGALLLASPEASEASFSLASSLPFSVPAVIYCVNNNLVFFILSRLDATTFQLLSQLKVVFTGVLFRIFLGRRLAPYQWLAILQLGCGTVTSQLPAFDQSRAKGEVEATASGVVLAVASCALSAFGGIYAEKLLKAGPATSIHAQNIQLYAWGILINACGVFAHSGLEVFRKGFFAGFSGWAWAVVLNNALNGLAISAILKYADNIARVYAHACAMLVTMALSVPLFGKDPNAHMLIAVLMVGLSAVQYNLDARTIVAVDRGAIGTEEDEAEELLPEDEQEPGGYAAVGERSPGPDVATGPLAPGRPVPGRAAPVRAGGGPR